MDRSRYDSAMFWLPFGTAAAVIGLALMTIGLTRLPQSQSFWTSVWFDAGLGLLGVGALLLLWSLLLFLSRGRGPIPSGDPAATGRKESDWKDEAVRGYYRERQQLFRAWDKGRKKKRQ